MLTVLPFPRNIKTQIILSFQWLSVRLNNARLNSSSSGSSSDSDSDPNPSEEKTSFKTNDAAKRKGFKGRDYLRTSQKISEKMIEKQMNFFFSKHQFNASSNFPDKTKKIYNYNRREPSVLKELQREQQKLKSVENEFNRKHDVPILRELQREQQKLKSVENEFNKKHDVSILRELQREQQKLKSNIATKTKQQEGKEPPITYEPIFNREVSETNNAPELETWKMCEENEIKTFMKQYPRNAFEEMIRWTEDGKLWQFPINNEQGMETEKKIHFSEHIFLEQHLEDWCPVKGPIRHFMELVCIGLSKNPYLTVEEKKAHIHWYKDYFGSKQDLLQRLGVVE